MPFEYPFDSEFKNVRYLKWEFGIERANLNMSRAGPDNYKIM